mmetsp:Transcript_21739/g.67869  ORF Transcript_21739/g.67869 Transcript_21739/m.67869 type:complete len:222 (+) Transcript_21739:246-911(+)
MRSVRPRPGALRGCGRPLLAGLALGPPSLDAALKDHLQDVVPFAHVSELLRAAGDAVHHHDAVVLPHLPVRIFLVPLHDEPVVHLVDHEGDTVGEVDVHAQAGPAHGLVHDDLELDLARARRVARAGDRGRGLHHLLVRGQALGASGIGGITGVLGLLSGAALCPHVLLVGEGRGVRRVRGVRGHGARRAAEERGPGGERSSAGPPRSRGGEAAAAVEPQA